MKKRHLGFFLVAKSFAVWILMLIFASYSRNL